MTKWTNEDEKVLIEKYENRPQKEILSSLSIEVNWDQVKRKARKLGLRRDTSAIRIKWSDEEILDMLLKLSKKLGRTPKIEDVDLDKNMPSTTVYQKRFGSWNNALRKLGLELNSNFDFTKEDIMNEIIDYYKKNGRSPYWNEVSFSTTVWKKHWQYWNDLLNECKTPLNKVYHDLKTKKDGVKYLLELKEKLDRIPTTSDVQSEGINRNWFTEVFGSWKDALYSAGLIDKVELENTYEKMANSSIQSLIQLAKELNRVPAVEEYEEFLKTKDNVITRRNLCNRLELSYSEICTKYLPTEILKKDKNCYLNKDNVRCRSIAEMKISNLFIDNNLIVTYEPRYSELTDGKYNYRFDWKIGNIYIEYFGLFEEKETYGNEILESYREKTLKKIDICEEYKISLLSIFPEDLENNYEGLIRKFNKYGVNLKVIS